MKLYNHHDGSKQIWSYNPIVKGCIPELTQVYEVKRRLAITCIHFRLEVLGYENISYRWILGDILKDGDTVNNFSTWYNLLKNNTI